MITPVEPCFALRHRRPRRPPPPRPALPRYVIGLDLGQAADHTAVAIVEVNATVATDRHAGPGPDIYHVRHLDRAPLGTPYPAVVARIAEILTRPPLRGNARLIIDQTGVGRPVVDLFRVAGLEPLGVTLTAGLSVTGGPAAVNVPKRDVISSLQVLFHGGQIRIAAELPHAATLLQELAEFRVRITPAGNEQWGAWREGAHDDLVLALGLACWWPERRLRRWRIAVARERAAPAADQRGQHR